MDTSPYAPATAQWRLEAPHFEDLSPQRAMGHTRLGPIPKSRPWTAVVATFAGGAGGGAGGASQGDEEGTRDSVVQPLDRSAVAAVADQTLAAAPGGLERAKDDPGLLYAVYLLTQVALASRRRPEAG